MTTELLKDFIGKKCSVFMLNSVCGQECTIIAVEDNWIKAETKNSVIMLNSDMISNITLMKEKKKKKSKNGLD